MIVVAAVAWLVVRYTGYGRTLLATGGNKAAARLAGVPAGRVTMLAYVVSATPGRAGRSVVIGTTAASDANNAGWASSSTPSPRSRCPAPR